MYLLHKTISLVWTRYIGSIYHALKNKTPRLAGLGGFGRAISDIARAINDKTQNN